MYLHAKYNDYAAVIILIVFEHAGS